MRALSSGQGWRDLHRGRRRIGRDGAFHPDGLAPDNFEPGAPDSTAWPSSAEDGSKRKLGRRFFLRRRGIRARSVEWPQHRTHSSGFKRGAALLTLCPQRTGAAMADACGIQDPQGAIMLGTPFLGIQRMVGRTTQRPIGLRNKSGTGKASRKRRASPSGRAIDERKGGFFSGCRLFFRNWFSLKNWGKLGRAQLS